MFLVFIALVGGLVSTVAYARQPEILTSALNWGSGLFRTEPASPNLLQQRQTVSPKNGASSTDAGLTEKSAQPQQQNKSDAREVPDYIVFDVLFNMVGQLDREADKLESEGRNGRIWRDYLKDRGGLNDEELLILKDVAKKFVSELEPVHNRAMEIIAERRAKYPNGLAQKGEKMPPPTLELTQLQQRRQEIAQQNRDYLQSRLEAPAFERLQSFSRQKFAADGTRILGEEAIKLLKERAEKGAAENKMILDNNPQGEINK
ncbi:MAG TPA: hypothetical protein VF599_24110 [Pyrinomonadaceae bacterium]